jgi:molybdopterin-guanine dinucleotide biosynthesis protein A
MGTDKTRLRIGRQSMLERVVDRLKAQTGWLVLSVNEDGGLAGSTGLPVAPDEGAEFGGPLFGILSGLKWARRNTDAKWIVSAPADAPFLPGDLVVRLRAGLTQDAEIAVAGSRGRVHPIIALVPVSLAGALDTWLAEPSQRAAKSWLATRRWSAVDFPADGARDPFFNVNTPEDLATARAQAGKTT